MINDDRNREVVRRLAVASLAMLIATAVTAVPVAADPIAFKTLYMSRATFTTDAPLETIVGNTSGAGVTGSLTVDPAKPRGVKGVIKVDLTTVKTGIDKRDADMRGKDYLDTENEANRFAVFEIKSVDIAGPLEPGREMPARVRGMLTIKQKPVEVVADARVSYVKLTPEQLENQGQKKFGFTSDVLKIRAKFETKFTNHGMQVPQLLFLKVSNDIQLETDLTLVRE